MPLWTPAQVAAAYDALSPAPATLADAAAALNAQGSSVLLDVPTSTIAEYLALAGKYQSFLAWGASPPAGASVASVQAAQLLAAAFQNPRLFAVMKMSNPAVASQMETWLAALVAPGTGITGPIVAADQTAILALAQQPEWSPPLTVADLTTIIG